MTFYQQIKVSKSEIVLDMRGSFVVHFTHLKTILAPKNEHHGQRLSWAAYESSNGILWDIVF